jgi:hypothetical protein
MSAVFTGAGLLVGGAYCGRFARRRSGRLSASRRPVGAGVAPGGCYLEAAQIVVLSHGVVGYGVLGQPAVGQADQGAELVG